MVALPSRFRNTRAEMVAVPVLVAAVDLAQAEAEAPAVVDGDMD